MNTADIQTALANEARRSELRQKIAKLQGAADATASVMQRLATLNNDTAISLGEATSQLGALEAGAGAGVTDDFGWKSAVTQMQEAEREAGKRAVIDLLKGNAAATEAESVAAWTAAAIATHPEFPHSLQDAGAVGLLYRTRLAWAGLIADTSWASQAAWVVATDEIVILAAV